MTETRTRTVPMAWICEGDTIIHEDGTLTIENIGPHPWTEEWLQVLGTHISPRGVLVGHDHSTPNDALVELVPYWLPEGT